MNAGEVAVRGALTETLFGTRPEPDPDEPGFLKSLYLAKRGVPFSDREKGKEVLHRAVTNVTTAGIGGLIGVAEPGVWAREQAERLDAGAARVIREIATPIDGTGKVWVPRLGPILPTDGAAQTGEKNTVPSSETVDVQGSELAPELIGEVWDLSWSVLQGAEDRVVALLAAKATRKCLDYLLGVLGEGAPSAPTLAEAIAQVEANGYPAAFVVGSQGAWAKATDLAPVDVRVPVHLGGLTDALYVVGALGTFIGASQEFTLRATEASLAGYEVGAYHFALAQADVGSVIAIGAPA